MYFKFLLLFCLLFINCKEIPEPKPQTGIDQSNPLNVLLQYDHNLISLNSFSQTITKQTSNTSGCFLLVAGGFNSSSLNETNIESKVKFLWKNYKNEYVLSEFPLSIIRLKIIDSTETPYCKFRWTSQYTNDESQWQQSIKYVVICIRENQIKYTNKKIELKI